MSARPCPTWCTSRHTAGPTVHMGEPIRVVTDAERFESVRVRPLLDASPTSQRGPEIAVFAEAAEATEATAFLDPQQAAAMAGVMEQLGQTEMAEAFRAALARLDAS